MKLKFSSDVKQIPQYSTLQPTILYLPALNNLPWSRRSTATSIFNTACSPYSIPPLWQLALDYFAGPTLHKFRRSLRRLFLLSKTGFVKFLEKFLKIFAKTYNFPAIFNDLTDLKNFALTAACHTRLLCTGNIRPVHGNAAGTQQI